MELNHLKYFYQVAKHASFTEASKRLRIAQPSISKMVKQLEEAQGARLLDRSKRGGVFLTELGKVYFESCEKIFGELSNLDQSTKHFGNECSGLLAVGASDNICNYLLPKHLAKFVKEYPKVSLKLLSGTSEEIKDEILRGDTELGLFHSKPKEDLFKVTRLGFSGFVIVHSALLQPKKSRLNLGDLDLLPLLAPRIADYPRNYPILKMLTSAGVKPRTFFEANSQETQKRLALKGIGYAVLPQYMIEMELREGSLSMVRVPKPLGSEVFLVSRRTRTLSRPATAFQVVLNQCLL